MKANNYYVIGCPVNLTKFYVTPTNLLYKYFTGEYSYALIDPSYVKSYISAN